MPELPEVETQRRGLSEILPGARVEKVVLRRKDLRQPMPQHLSQTVKGLTFLRLERRAKYLLFYLEKGWVLLSHLGMSGSWILAPADYMLQTHDHVVLTLKAPKRSEAVQLVYHDPRRFGLLLLLKEEEVATHPLLGSLGKEPLKKSFSASYLAKALAKRKGPVKPVLMDQKLVVGVGNIYASEALFCAKLHPETPAPVAAAHAKELVACIRHVLEKAIASGGSTLRNYRKADGASGYFQHHFNVYGRAGKPCYVCGHDLRGITLAGRSTFFCPHCQKKQRK